jgi:hypothetical protein
MSGLNRFDWNHIVRRVQEGQELTPFISDAVCTGQLPGNDTLAEAWATDIEFPQTDAIELARLAHFLGISTNNKIGAKEEFLDFSKKHLLNANPPTPLPKEERDKISSRLFDIRYAELAAKLNYFTPEECATHPVYRLAKLDLPIYVTTSPYNFIELALIDAGKRPRVEICYWHKDLKTKQEIASGQNLLIKVIRTLTSRFNDGELRDLSYEIDVDYESLPGEGKSGKARELVAYVDRRRRLKELLQIVKRSRPDISWSTTLGDVYGDSRTDLFKKGLSSVFELDPDYVPSPMEPLVYHLHGLDLYPPSLVLTEDDHMDFLVKVSWDKDAIPFRISEALVDSSLLLLGYDLDDWDFRVLFRGLIIPKSEKRRFPSFSSVSIQLTPGSDVEATRAYLKEYFNHVNFKVYWGEAHQFVDDLWERLGERS